MTQELLLVGVNVEKSAYRTTQRGMKRISHGIYCREDADMEALFQEYAVRIAQYYLKNAFLTHACAWRKKPIGHFVFMAGDYPYRKRIAESDGDFQIVQSLVRFDTTDNRLFKEVPISDGLGVFTMRCATPELVLLQNLEATKRFKEKHLSEEQFAQLYQHLLREYGSKHLLMEALEQIARASDHIDEYKRFVTWVMRQLTS